MMPEVLVMNWPLRDFAGQNWGRGNSRAADFHELGAGGCGTPNRVKYTLFVLFARRLGPSAPAK
jgi:hypothetical protein